MIIVSASDTKFVPGLLILIYSTWVHNQNARFYIIDAGISAEGRQRLTDFCDKHNIVCKVLKGEHPLLARLPKPKHWSSAAYARLSIPELLPEHDRAIYLDGDAIVNSDISELWSLELGDNVIAGVLDGMISPSFLAEIDIRADEYINSGVVVMDLARWRTERLGEQAMELLLERPDLEFPDQTAINLVAKGRIHYLDRKFNFFAREYTRFRKIIPRIIHYPGPDKPWRNKRSPFSEIYDAYRRVSGADIPNPPSGWEFKAFRRTVLGLLSLRPKYWRLLIHRRYYQSHFIEPHIQALQAKACVAQENAPTTVDASALSGSSPQ